jgi:hypothetical protein
MSTHPNAHDPTLRILVEQIDAQASHVRSKKGAAKATPTDMVLADAARAAVAKLLELKAKYTALTGVGVPGRPVLTHAPARPPPSKPVQPTKGGWVDPEPNPLPWGVTENYAVYVARRVDAGLGRLHSAATTIQAWWRQARGQLLDRRPRMPATPSVASRSDTYTGQHHRLKRMSWLLADLQRNAPRAVWRELLSTPTSTTIKYDGTNVGISDTGTVYGPVRDFRQKLTLEDAIGSHTCSPEASRRVTNGIPLGRPIFLPVHCNLRPNTEGRKTAVPSSKEEYQKVPLNCVRDTDVAAVKAAIFERIHATIAAGTPVSGPTTNAVATTPTAVPEFQLVLYGELMCNSGKYNYAEEGLGHQWLPFGARIRPLDQGVGAAATLCAALVGAGFAVGGHGARFLTEIYT